MNFNTARFFLSRLESLSAAPTSLSFLRFRSKSSKSSEGGQSWPLRAQWRDSVIYSALLHKSHRLAYPRISVVAFVILSVGLCQSRKDPYLPLEPLCVRLLPRPTGLPAHGSRSNLSSAYADVKSLLPPSSPKMYSRLSGCASLIFISRPTRSLFE